MTTDEIIKLARKADADRLAQEHGCGPIEAAMISGAGRAYIEAEARRLATIERCSPPEIAAILGIGEADAAAAVGAREAELDQRRARIEAIGEAR